MITALAGRMRQEPLARVDECLMEAVQVGKSIGLSPAQLVARLRSLLGDIATAGEEVPGEQSME